MDRIVSECPKCKARSHNPNYRLFYDWHCITCNERFITYKTMKDFNIDQYFIVRDLYNKMKKAIRDNGKQRLIETA